MNKSEFGSIKFPENIVIIKKEYSDFTNKEMDLILSLKEISCDIETNGLVCYRDRICKIQIFDGNNIYIFDINKVIPSNLKLILENDNLIKVLHNARLDLAFLKFNGVNIKNVFCTKVASLITRTYSKFHSMKDLIKEFLKINISKEKQQSDWGMPINNYDKNYIDYLANDVIFLLDIKVKILDIAKRENRINLIQKANTCLLILSDLEVGSILIEFLSLFQS